MYGILFNKIGGLAAIAAEMEETWVSLSLSGQYKLQYSKTLFSELNEALDQLGKARCITYRMGNAVVTLEELQESLVDDVQWSVGINKQAFMGNGEEICNFFFDSDSFRRWADSTDPFSAGNPLNSHKSKIEVNGLQTAFGGPNFLVSGNLGDFPNDRRIAYEHDRLKSVLRQFTETTREIYPEKHYISFGDVDVNSRPFFRNSLMCFSVALSDELYGDKVVLRGIRRLEFSLQTPLYQDGQMSQAQETLCDAFSWVFCGDNRYELRHKLLIDRLTLDLPLDQSYYEGIIPLIGHALQQANERYNYAFFERSSEYQKELQQFLKELHELCDSYSTKVRSLLGSFLRDALAGFLTVAITIFARVRDLEKLDSGNVLNYIFCAYGIYLVISCLSQVIVDWKDLQLSEGEIDYWKSVSRGYMREQDFEVHKKETVKKRKTLAIRQYWYVCILYIAFAVFSFSVPKLWENLSTKDNQMELTKNQSNKEKLKENSVNIDSVKNGKDTLSGNNDTTVCHTPGRK